MVERICPACRHANPIENRYCGACGQGLEPQPLARRPETAITIAGQQLPAAQLRQVGKAVALGLAAVAAEAGMAWLRKKAAGGSALPAVSLARKPEPTTALAERAAAPLASAITVVSQRVVEVWEEGSLTRQVIEKHVWRKTSE